MGRVPLSAVLTLAFAWLPGFSSALAADPGPTRYLNFQVMTGIDGFAGPQPEPGRLSLSKAQLEEFVGSVVAAIGTTGDSRHKLGFTVGPLCLDMSDDETRRFIRDAFAVAAEKDVAVALHVDDSMVCGRRKDLLADPENIETTDWGQVPSKGRRADWGPKPTRFPPPLCYNSPVVQNAVRERAGLIGSEVRKGLQALEASGKGHLFAGVIAGWETQMPRDFETGRSVGYRALARLGFDEQHPPRDIDRERVGIVRAFIDLWARSLAGAGVPPEKVYCHIAFTAQGLRAPDARESYAAKVNFATPDVAFGPSYRPGFSTYPEGTTLEEVAEVVGRHGSPGWISAEGTNVSPTSMPGEATMETYLARLFNHGAVMVNLFSWGMGGEAMRDNFFRKATENPEALAAYGKFLRGLPLEVSKGKGFSGPGFQAKVRRIQKELPEYARKSGHPERLMPMARRLEAAIRDRDWSGADRVADEILATIAGRSGSSRVSGGQDGKNSTAPAEKDSSRVDPPGAS